MNSSSTSPFFGRSRVKFFRLYLVWAIRHAIVNHLRFFEGDEAKTPASLRRRILHHNAICQFPPFREKIGQAKEFVTRFLKKIGAFIQFFKFAQILTLSSELAS